jgi:hypothetical protein
MKDKNANEIFICGMTKHIFAQLKKEPSNNIIL